MCCHSGARAIPGTARKGRPPGDASPESKNTDLRKQKLGVWAWVPGLALKGHPGTTAEFFRNPLNGREHTFRE